MHRSLRFFQPIGCALITLALIDTVTNSFWLLLQYFSLEHKFFRDETANEEFYKNLVWNFLIALRFLLSLIFWVGVIFRGKNSVLFLHLILSFITDAATFTLIILEKVATRTEDELELNIWGLPVEDPWPTFISLGTFTILRLYFLFLEIQGVIGFHRKYEYSDHASEEDLGGLLVSLEPVGQGFFEIWAFFKDFPGMGAIVLLTTEFVWNLEHLGLRELFAYNLERDWSLLELEVADEVVDYVFLEDNLLRVIRIILALIGLFCVHKERLNLVRLWILAYFLSLICSNIILALSVALKGVGWIVFHGICHGCDILFRIMVLYYSFKFAIVHTRTIMK